MPSSQKNGSKSQPAEQHDRLAQPVEVEDPPRIAFPVIGIGGSAGGLEAFLEFFEKQSPTSGMAFVIVQHLPPERESMVAQIIAKRTSMPVIQVEDGMAVEVDHVYVIRPGRTLTISDGRLHLGEPTEKPGHRRPVDDFFKSLAAEQRERAVAIIMSGMGSNGTAGIQSIKAVGGMCIAQSPESAKFPSMPRNLIDSGMADFILRPEDMPDVLLRYVNHPYAKGDPSIEEMFNTERHAFNEIIAILRTRSRQEFSGYKKPTVLRRIQRRMGLHQFIKLGEYVRLLRTSTAEVTALADDLVIHVTGFFRDGAAWEALKQRVLVPLVAERDSNSSLRVWVTACSSGEEAYTLAVLLCEVAAEAGKTFDIKIFATDLADRMLAHARSGVYPGGIESEVSQERLQRYFDKEDSVYRIKKEIRELVVFAPQNLLQDPPFSRLDICTCRNLLIYLEPEVQQKVLALLHFGLREGGVLFLGNSESISGTDDMFEPIDKKWRIFRRIGPTRHGQVDFPRLVTAPRAESDVDADVIRPMTRASIGQITQRALLDRFTPPTVVVDRQQRVVYFHGDTSPFLYQPHGEPTREILSMTREGIRGALRVGLHKAMVDGEAATVRDGYVEGSHGRMRIAISVAPLESKTVSGYYLVSFEEWIEPRTTAEPEGNGVEPTSVQERRQMIDELQRVRDELQSTVEELQTSNEELKASNEEVTSVNEELQSTNEELETSKEELQSLNEELTTVNSQLQAKMEELEETTSDLSSLLSSTDIAVLFLDTQFRIRRFTPAVRDLVELIPTDIGRSLNDLAKKFTDPALLSDAQEVLSTLIPREAEISSTSDHYYVRRILPYRTIDNRIEGVVITFVDITRRKAAEVLLHQEEEKYRLIVNGVKDYAIILLDANERVDTWNFGAERIFGYSESEAVGQHSSFIFTHEDRANGAATQELKTARDVGQSTDERWHLRKDGSRFWGSGMLTSLHTGEGSLRGYVKVMRDNTDRKLAAEQLETARHTAERANEAKDQFLATVSHELRTPLSVILLWSKMIQQGVIKQGQLNEALVAIHRSADSQKKLIEDLLDTSRIVAGTLRLDMRVADLTPIAQLALDEIQPAAHAKGITLVKSFEPSAGRVRVDPDRMRQIFMNLLVNAVKFTPEGGQITFQLRREGESVRVVVKDSGKGITREFLAHIFNRFAQAENTRTRSQGGLGLGLAITKQLVNLHGGTIVCDSDGADKGSSFTLEFPISHLNVSTPPLMVDTYKDSTHGTDPLKGMSILLVEDDNDTRHILEKTLSGYGASMTVTASASQAMDAFVGAVPHLIISDIGMPDTDGYTFLKQIREWERTHQLAETPAIALTAFTREEDFDRALATGFKQCMAKPVDVEYLIKACATLGTTRRS